MLQLSSYIAVHALPTPPQHDVYQHTDSWPMLANDKFNCCTSAAAGHMVHHWTSVNQDSVVLTDTDIIRAHAELTHDDLNQPVSMLTALKFWRKTGIGDHQIHSFMSAGKAKADTLRAVIYLFGAAYIGLDLPNFALPRKIEEIQTIQWEIIPGISPADAAPQECNGHCVAAIGYDEKYIYVVTWGTLKTMSWDFFTQYTDEAYAVLSTDWVQKDKVAPSGFDLHTLERDLSTVTGAARPSRS
jgi:hypothetical protein